jgi:hypothetical protein
LSRNSRYVGLFWVGVWFVTFLVGFALESFHRYQRIYEKARKIETAQKIEASGEQGWTEGEQPRRSNAQVKAMDEIMQEEIEDAKTDWRPLASYAGNLDRIGQALLGADSCWQKLSLTMPEGQRSIFLFANMGRRYPWEWSALLLIGLFGVSVCILNFRVKSLDRLR